MRINNINRFTAVFIDIMFSRAHEFHELWVVLRNEKKEESLSSKKSKISTHKVIVMADCFLIYSVFYFVYLAFAAHFAPT